MIFVTDSNAKDRRWHRAASAKGLSLCGQLPKRGERWPSCADNLIGKHRMCRQCTTIKNELNEIDLVRKEYDQIGKHS
jgi:hypothetical protein